MSLLVLILVLILWGWGVAAVGSALDAPRWVEWTVLIVGALIIGGVL